MVANSLLERLRRTYAAIAEVEDVAAQQPHDPFVLANLASLRSAAEELEQAWESECREQRIEICRYRMFGSADLRAFRIRSVTHSIVAFQDLFTSIFDSLKNGPKKRGRFSDEVIEQTAFGIEYTFSGSLGIALSVGGDVDFFRSAHEEAIDVFLM